MIWLVGFLGRCLGVSGLRGLNPCSPGSPCGLGIGGTLARLRRLERELADLSTALLEADADAFRAWERGERWPALRAFLAGARPATASPSGTQAATES
jgi:hypothetical protein